ncbi:gluconate utilization system Gnt-I transcriptional repressor [Aquitalea magnusonii]|uniref:Gluconate utilization system Gnt-I transcriptional repressor n=1 Tax=Aquitalea magnusonii TaxID=332411 RepID=A0A3G9GCY8_9NEIS|nr:LacI family DNA-binding transcriptional regulator [Aquitalea magnusonii]BBF84663.1 gluconate utilization system Gnt-I transcriptional repressor [Aquitalea magnusonii]
MSRKPRLRAGSGITMHDVGQAAGVSAITVSRALNTPDRVSPALREKIMQVVEQLGYVPNRSARQLASARSHTVLVLIPSLSNTVFIDALAGIESVLQAAGYQMLIGNTHYSSEEELALLRAYLQHSPDGLLVTGLTQHEAFRQILERQSLPAVYMMDLSDDGRPCVGFSQEAAGACMTQHLLARGKRRIAFMGAQLDERVMKRLAGYRLVLQQAGCHAPALEWLNPAPSSMQMGADMLDALLAAHPDCDAVFCCNDDLAIGAIARCQQRGIRLPEQLAIGGFNDLQSAAWTTPPLSSIATPRFEIGQAAARMLLQQIEGLPLSHERLDLGFRLQQRSST